MRHPVTVELEAYIYHTIFGDLSPGIKVVIIHRNDLLFQDLISFVQIIFILIMYGHVFVVGFGHYKTIVSVVDKFRDPSIIR